MNTPINGIRIPESGKFLLMESGIPLTIGIQNPSYNDNDWNPVSWIRNPRCEIQNPRLSWILLHEVMDEYLDSILKQ